MNDMVERIRKCGFKDIKLLSEGGHGRCYFVKRNGVSYILKTYFNNNKSEAEHEEKIIKELHGESKGNPYFFKAEIISDSNDVCFLLSETNDGKTLKELRENNKEYMSLVKATEIMIKACDTVQEIHDKGYVHFDIKPSNLYLVDKISHVIAIDFGSSVKTGEKTYEEIINSNAYWSTRGFLTKRLSDFCDKLITYRKIIPTVAEKNSLIEAELSLSKKEDIFALICTYWYLITGEDSFGIWNRNMQFLSTDQKIEMVLKENNIPIYLIRTLVEIFLTIDEPTKNADVQVPFNSVFELKKRFEAVKEILENRGFHPEVLLRNSIEFFRKNFQDIIIDPDLLCDIEEMEDIDNNVR